MFMKKKTLKSHLVCGFHTLFVAFFLEMKFHGLEVFVHFLQLFVDFEATFVVGIQLQTLPNLSA